MKIGPYQFKNVLAIDFEFHQPPGERSRPICMVVCDLETGVTKKYWESDLRGLTKPPFPVDQDTLIVAYYASAEMGCFLSLGWKFPRNILDLFTEFRCLTNGKSDSGAGLLSALAYCGVGSLSCSEKKEMQNLAIRGGPFSEKEAHDLMEYCESDVVALYKLLPKLIPYIDLPRALLRGWYMGSAAVIESNGIPIDVLTLKTLEANWPEIQKKLIAEVDHQYNVFEGLTFKTDRFSNYLNQNNIPWPRLDSGKLELKEQTFEDMAIIYPQLADLQMLRSALAQMRSSSLPVGSDGRNRAMLSAFRSVTGRNQPKTKEFVFGRSSWFRHVIKPEDGMALASIDWSQQEFGIAAALSNDKNMISAYESGDPYLAAGKQAGVIPPDGTKETHKKEREQFKQCCLAILFGGGPNLVAMRTGLTLFEAKELMAMHKKSYPDFWKWIGSAVDRAMLGGSLHTVFGWKYHPGKDVKQGTLLNFPMQANGAEMLRLACCNATGAGIKICAPIHDALLIEAPIEGIDEAIIETQKVMAEASRVVLGGALTLRSDVKIIKSPDRYCDERGVKMWNSVTRILKEITDDSL